MAHDDEDFFESDEDRESREAAESEQGERERRKLVALGKFAETYDGRAFLWDLLSRCGVYKVSFTGDNQTFFNEGRRDIGVWALSMIFEADPDAYTLMRTEATERDSEHG